MLPGLSGMVFGRKLSATISRLLGTNIGDMTGGGGLAAAFDGTTGQSRAASAAYLNSPAGLAYVGKDYGAGVKYAVDYIKAYPTSDFGFVQGTNYTLTIYGSNSAPANATNGTALGNSGSVADITSGSVTVSSSDKFTGYRYIWAAITSSLGAGADIHASEIEVVGWSA